MGVVDHSVGRSFVVLSSGEEWPVRTFNLTTATDLLFTLVPVDVRPIWLVAMSREGAELQRVPLEPL